MELTLKVQLSGVCTFWLVYTISMKLAKYHIFVIFTSSLSIGLKLSSVQAIMKEEMNIKTYDVVIEINYKSGM